jgi:hypothetical protein
MDKIYLAPGLYANIFKLNIQNEKVTVFQSTTAIHQRMSDLRVLIKQNKWDANVYRIDNIVFAYGKDAEKFLQLGFEKQTIYLFDQPKLCNRLIREGLIEYLKSENYRGPYGKARIIFYEPQPYEYAAKGEIKVFRGYDLRTIYQYQNDTIFFGLIVDVCWEIQDKNGQRLNMVEIANYNATNEIAQIQGELLSNNQINTEISKFMLDNHIMPFVCKIKEFKLPLDRDIKVSLENIPIRIIEGA